MKKHRPPLSQDDYNDICCMYEAKTPPGEICEKYGIHRSTLPKMYKRVRGITASLLPSRGNERYFQKLDSHEKAYFLGFIAADGCIVDNKNTHKSDTLAINIHEKDRAILDRFREAVGFEHAIHIISGKHQVGLKYNSQAMCDDLRQYGLGYRKSLTMPNILPLIPKRYRDAFVLGYNDGDGCILLKKTVYRSPKGYTKLYINPAFSICGTFDFLMGLAEHLQLKSIVITENKSIHVLSINRKDDFYSTYLRIYSNSADIPCLARKRDVIFSMKQVETISSSSI